MTDLQTLNKLEVYLRKTASRATNRDFQLEMLDYHDAVQDAQNEIQSRREFESSIVEHVKKIRG